MITVAVCVSLLGMTYLLRLLTHQLITLSKTLLCHLLYSIKIILNDDKLLLVPIINEMHDPLSFYMISCFSLGS